MTQEEPAVPADTRERYEFTADELSVMAKERFGLNPWGWAFVCPNCGDIANARDFKAAGADPNIVGQECIGRALGALKGPPTRDAGRSIAKRGCDWTAYGFIRGPWLITLPNQHVVGSFRLAPAGSAVTKATGPEPAPQPKPDEAGAPD